MANISMANKRAKQMVNARTSADEDGLGKWFISDHIVIPSSFLELAPKQMDLFQQT